MGYVINGFPKDRFPFCSEEGHVDFGDAIVQKTRVYVRDPDLYERLKDIRQDKPALDCECANFFAYLKDTLKIIVGDRAEVIYKKVGEFEGYGHGKVVVAVRNPDGSEAYRYSEIVHCDGPGSMCSYSHGPWFSHGRFHGNSEISEDMKLREVVSRFLNREATFDDLRRAVQA